MQKPTLPALGLLLTLAAATLHAQTTAPIADRGLDIPFPSIGKVQPRHARDIAASNWSIGGETLDRDYADYDAYKRYLGLLGAKQIRLQGGWAKTEKQRGVYDFAWLDRIIDDALSQGVEPWVQASYGNGIYPGGGQANLGGGAPTSEEALQAWDRWVRAMAERYRGRVKVWEVWNEPDIGRGVPAPDYARLFIRTAEILRSVDPEATIYALSIANPGKLDYIGEVLDSLRARGKLHLVDEITFHGYRYNPDESYGTIARLRDLVASYSPRIRLRQGEQGAPSENQPILALRNYPWTETSQAKWALRRLLGDFGRDIPSLYFQISDMHYAAAPDAHAVGHNTKGLLATDSTHRVVGIKAAYHAVQHLTSLFDHTLERIPNYPYATSSRDTALNVFGYRKAGSDQQVVTLWLGGATPGNTNQKTPVDFTFPAGKFDDPVYVDLRTGDVYDIPEASWSRTGTQHTFRGIPIYDSPVLIADRSVVQLGEGGR
jgi:hypothetical protein